MILLVIVRRAYCEVCHEWWDMGADEKPRERCVFCGSTSWEFGPDPKDSIFIRTGKAHAKKRLNPGAKSRARQEQGLKQWRRFKPKTC